MRGSSAAISPLLRSVTQTRAAVGWKARTTMSRPVPCIPSTLKGSPCVAPTTASISASSLPISAPWGGSVQYRDEALHGNAQPSRSVRCLVKNFVDGLLQQEQLDELVGFVGV